MIHTHDIKPCDSEYPVTLVSSTESSGASKERVWNLTRIESVHNLYEQETEAWNGRGILEDKTVFRNQKWAERLSTCLNRVKSLPDFCQHVSNKKWKRVW